MSVWLASPKAVNKSAGPSTTSAVEMRVRGEVLVQGALKSQSWVVMRTVATELRSEPLAAGLAGVSTTGGLGGVTGVAEPTSRARASVFIGISSELAVPGDAIG